MEPGLAACSSSVVPPLRDVPVVGRNISLAEFRPGVSDHVVQKTAFSIQSLDTGIGEHNLYFIYIEA